MSGNVEKLRDFYAMKSLHMRPFGLRTGYNKKKSVSHEFYAWLNNIAVNVT
jgi:hypothetical protein